MTSGDILNAVTRRCGVTRFDLCGRRRWPKFVFARRVAVAVLTAHRYSLKEIGRLLNRDHTSIMHLRDTAGVAAEAAGEVLEHVKGGA